MKINRSIMENIHTDNLLYDVRNKLEGNGFRVIILNDLSLIKKLINEIIPEESLVGLDGSDIIYEFNIPVFLRENWNVIVDPFKRDNPQKIKNYLINKLQSVEYYITQPDVITCDGKVIFKDKNNFLTNKNQAKPENIIALTGSDNIVTDLAEAQNKLKSKNLTILEVSPYGLQRRDVDNYGQIEDYHDFMTNLPHKQNTFNIVLLSEEHVY